MSGKETETNRIGNVIEAAVLHTCNVAGGYAPFTAEKIIIELEYPKNEPLMVAAIDGITQMEKCI